MGRIRSIKPEFPQLERLGNVSRDARLCFVELWTLADDDGRLRGASRMVASLLFPYDLDASDLIDHWLDELEREKLIVRYKVEDQSYIFVTTWYEDQKIDHRSASKFPPPPNPREDSRAPEEDTPNPREDSPDEGDADANAREPSPLDQGSRTEDQGPRTEDAREGASGESTGPPTPEVKLLQPKYPKIDWKALQAEWEKIPGNPSIKGGEFRLLNVLAREILPFVNGLLAEDVLQAVRNYGMARSHPQTWWSTNPDIVTWFKKHLDRFLPGNFDLVSYIEKESGANDDYHDRLAAEALANLSEDAGA